MDRQAREAKLAQQGVFTEEIQKIRRKRRFQQEDHKDDCGSDVNPLESKSLLAALGADGSLGAAIDYCFGGHQDCCTSSAESSEGKLERIMADNYSLRYLAGSRGGVDDSGGWAAQVPIHEFVGYLSKPKLVGVLDVVEIFGGFGGVGEFCVRRRLRNGENFDLATGFDLCKPAHQRHVLDYLVQRKPLVVILAPQSGGAPGGVARVPSHLRNLGILCSSRYAPAVGCRDAFPVGKPGG